jgi:hypothetical protein
LGLKLAIVGGVRPAESWAPEEMAATKFVASEADAWPEELEVAVEAEFVPAAGGVAKALPAEAEAGLRLAAAGTGGLTGSAGSDGIALVTVEIGEGMGGAVGMKLAPLLVSLTATPAVEDEAGLRFTIAG